MPMCVPVVLMSATILRDDVARCMDLLGKKNLCVLHGSLQRRTVNFSVFVSGRSGSSLRRSAREDLEENPESQQIWYTNSRTRAEDSLRDIADRLLEENRSVNNGPHLVSMPFVGTNEIMLKTTTMDAVKTYTDLEGEGTVLAPSSHRRIVDGT